MAYAAVRGTKWIIVVDGKPSEEFEAAGGLVFSSDGKSIAYTVWNTARRPCVILNGHRGPEYDFVVNDYPVFTSEGSLEYLVRKGASLYRVEHRPAR
jgi:hypothetical protein